MTAAKHTPGPWNASTSASSVVGWPVVSRQGRPICDIMGVPDGFPDEEKHNAESIANACLISAAPDLLEALEIVNAIADGDRQAIERKGYSFTGMPQTCSEWAQSKIKAAIAKAKGGAA